MIKAFILALAILSSASYASEDKIHDNREPAVLNDKSNHENGSAEVDSVFSAAQVYVHTTILMLIAMVVLIRRGS